MRKILLVPLALIMMGSSTWATVYQSHWNEHYAVYIQSDFDDPTVSTHTATWVELADGNFQELLVDGTLTVAPFQYAVVRVAVWNEDGSGSFGSCLIGQPLWGGDTVSPYSGAFAINADGTATIDVTCQTEWGAALAANLTFTPIAAPTSAQPINFHLSGSPSEDHGYGHALVYEEQVSGTISLDDTVVHTADHVANDPDAGLSQYVQYFFLTGGGTFTSPPRCADGIIQPSEGCDDGNLLDGDGCSARCTVESGWTCSGEPSSCVRLCNFNGVQDGDEEGVDCGGQSCPPCGG